MRRTISWILAAVMVLGLLTVIPFAVAAGDTSKIGTVETGYTPEGTAVNDAAGFAAMTADGKYYLAADITLAATYEADFTGTLDGNGKTVTTTVPMFKSLKGTVKNLIIAGTIDTSAVAGDTGALACRGEKVTLSNIKNSASVAGYKSGYDEAYGNFTTLTASTAGLVGAIKGTSTVENCENYGKITGGCIAGIAASVGYDTACEVKFKGCANYGELDDDGTDTVKTPNIGGEDRGVGGIVGNAMDIKAITFEDCLNKGAIKAIGYKKAVAGGIVGNITYSSTVSDTTVVIKNCKNEGEINASGQTGGILGFNSSGDLEVVDCINTAKISSIASTDTPLTNKGSYAGGIVGRTNRDDGNAEKAASIAKLTNCINTADIYSANGGTGGILSYIGKANKTLTGCFNSGNLTSATSVAGAIIGSMKGNEQTTAIYNCGNTGNITGKTYAGSFIGYCYASSTKSIGPVVVNCFSMGDVFAEQYACAVVGYFNSTLAEFRNNYVSGKLSTTPAAEFANGDTLVNGVVYKITDSGKTYRFIASAAGKATITAGTETTAVVVKIGSAAQTLIEADKEFTFALCWDNNAEALSVEKIKNNFMCIDANYLMFAAGKAASLSDAGACITAFAAADLASGKLCYDFNVAAKAADTELKTDLLFQTLGTDMYPVFDATHKAVELDGANYINPETFTITWDVDGTKTTAQVKKGETPKFEGTPTKAEDAEYTYEFEKWDKDIVAVTADATYTAVFKKTAKATTPTTEATTTEDPGTVAPTTEATTTAAPGTTAPAAEGGCAGCGGFAAVASVIAVICSGAAVVIIKKKA